uniref:E3 ubiquitin-protein ligase synoviolin-like n=1 Tax=Phallusia mammillata TaxID=59560 RepID=A0A6F9DTL6_9ASCI|nr:E3 ubiquitin-protein ligase synoviolin-like [Phallusia mammillata]
MIKMRGLVLTGASFALTMSVVVNAWMQKKQFYPTVVYLTKSSPCMAVLYLQAFVFVLLLGKLMRKIFFGQLRPAETEHLIEKSWYAVTDTCLAFTMFRDDFSPVFVAAFTILLFLKAFHWLLEDRVDFMERSPVITFVFKLRVLSLLAILLFCDVFFVKTSYQTTLTKGASVQLVFGFEYAILATIVLTVFLKYVLHLIDLQSENPWENKAVYMLYVELVTGFCRVLLYICFTAIMVKIHTFPLFSIRPMYLTMRQFKKAVSDIILSRRAIRNMNTLYPDATAEELASTDSTCIICREEMNAPAADAQPMQNATGVNKKLPCGHIFHASCLRSWFQRQQTCPTCRLDILQNQTRPQTPPQRPAPPPAQPGQGPYPPMYPPMYMPPPNMQHPMFQPPQNGQAPNPSTSESGNSAPSTSTAPPVFSPPPMPPIPGTGPMFMPPMPFMPPPPPIPPNFEGLSEDQVRSMEGHERRAVEMRIECLRNISLLMDAAFHQVQQYITVVQAQGDAGLRINAMPSFATQQQQQGSSSQADVTSGSHTNEKQDTSSGPTSTEDVPGPSGLPQTSAETNDTADAPSSSSTSNNGCETDDIPADANELRRRRLAKLLSDKSSPDHGKDD